jgi:predicted Zn-dependent protease with MMP-like domain
MDAELFADLVAEAIDSLPEQFQDALDNLEIAGEDWPDPWTRQQIDTSECSGGMAPLIAGARRVC